MSSILSSLNVPKDWKAKGGNQTEPVDNQTAAVANQTAPVDNQTAAVANKPDNENPPNAKSEYVRVDKETGP